MFFDDLERAANRSHMHEKRKSREDEKGLIPIDSHSLLDTGYTGRPDSDMQAQEEIDTVLWRDWNNKPITPRVHMRYKKGKQANGRRKRDN